MKSTLIPRNYKYLGEFPEFKENGLPSGYLINKGKVGCGGTSIALEDSNNTIVCVPFISLIKNKMKKYNTESIEVFGVYEGITNQEIQEYINNKVGAKKIMCTYDSLARVAKVTGYDYFLLVDELHLLFIQYVFRGKAVRIVLNEYSKFKRWAFLTATPIDKELMLEELKDIPTYNIEWEDTAEVKVKAVQCKQVNATVKKIINDFLDGKVFGNAHFFVNSVEFIASIVKGCNLTNENTRIIFSKNNDKYKNVCQGIINGETTDTVKKINFYTSTCFEGCDLFDKDGKIYIISDSSKSQTLLDISTQIRQIAGRIRDTQYYDTITHLYKATRYNEDLTFEEFKSVVLDEEKKAKSYIAKVNKDEELKNGTKESIYHYIIKDEESGNFVFDSNIMKLDIFNFKNLHHTYSLQVNISNEYNKAGITAICEVDKASDKLLKNESARTTFEEAIKEYNEIIQRKKNLIINFTDDERLTLLKKKYSYIKDAYEMLGMEQIKSVHYKTSNVKRLLVAFTNKMDNIAKVAKLLLTIPEFKEGNFLSGSSIKECMNNIYSYIGLNKNATINDFREFATIKEATKRIEGKQVRGYVIQYIKIK